MATEVCRRYRAEFPDELQRYGNAGNQWCVHDNQHLLNWAVEAVKPHFDINHEVSWLANLLEARGFPLGRLARGLDLGSEVVGEQITERAGFRLARTLSDTASFVRTHGSFVEFTL